MARPMPTLAAAQKNSGPLGNRTQGQVSNFPIMTQLDATVARCPIPGGILIREVLTPTCPG